MYNDEWSSDFLKNKLKDFNSIKEITSIENNLLKIERKKGGSFLVFTISLVNINIDEIVEIIESNKDIKFITNIKKEYSISGNAMNYLKSRKISFGGMGDFMRFCNQEGNYLLTDKEYSFVKRGLVQHSKVKEFKRIDNKRIEIKRHFLKDVIAVMNNDYDLGVESVRSFKTRFKEFRVMIVTNPNARVSSEAEKVAHSLKIDICKWGDFLGKLNSFWD